MRESAFYLIHLMSCALNDVHACRCRGASLMKSTRWRSSTAWRAWLGRRLAGSRCSGRHAEGMERDCDMTLYRCVSYGIEREAVLAALADRGLSWLPLKGALLVDLYPSPHMRSMADNDILYGS